MKTCAHWRQYIDEFFLKRGTFHIKFCRENQNTYFNKSFFSENRAVFNTVEKCGTVRQATDDIIRRMRFARWIFKATYTQSEYVILIVNERPLMVHYTYTAFFFNVKLNVTRSNDWLSSAERRKWMAYRWQYVCFLIRWHCNRMSLDWLLLSVSRSGVTSPPYWKEPRWTKKRWRFLVLLAGLSKKISPFQRPLQVTDTYEGALGREAK